MADEAFKSPSVVEIRPDGIYIHYDGRVGADHLMANEIIVEIDGRDVPFARLLERWRLPLKESCLTPDEIATHIDGKR